MEINQDFIGVSSEKGKSEKLPKFAFIYEEEKDNISDYKDILTEIISDRIRSKLNDISNRSVEK